MTTAGIYIHIPFCNVKCMYCDFYSVADRNLDQPRFFEALIKEINRFDFSSITEQHDNVHWFKTTAEQGYIFNIHVLNLNNGNSGRVYIDPNGEALNDGSIRARKISAAEATKLYG